MSQLNATEPRPLPTRCDGDEFEFTGRATMSMPDSHLAVEIASADGRTKLVFVFDPLRSRNFDDVMGLSLRVTERSVVMRVIGDHYMSERTVPRYLLRHALKEKNIPPLL